MKAMRVIGRMSLSLRIVFLILIGCTLSAQLQNHRVRNIVLTHGAWADGSGWKGVYGILVKDGYNVTVVQEPETSFKEDVAATKRVLFFTTGADHSCRPQLWRSGNYRSRDRSIRCWFGVHRGTHAGCWRE